MARTRYFPGESEQTLETALKRVNAEIMAGKTLTSWGSGDSSASKTQQVNPERLRDMIYHDLNQINPTFWPANSPTLATVGRFNDR